MLSLATVSLSACSPAISSRTGATILHGPHHSAQKSTSTGLSLPRTSLAKLASVTVLVLPAMVVLPVPLLEDAGGTTSSVVDLCPGPAPLQDPAARTCERWAAEGPLSLVEGL